MAARSSLLGSTAIGADGGLPVDRRGCLLAYLAVEGGWVSRDRLALLFWPDSEETMAKRNLRQLVLRTRRLPLDPPLETTADALCWPVDSDVAAFRHALAAGDVAAAVDAYGGPLLDGFSVHDVGGFDAWLEGERDRLRLAFLDAGVRRSDELLAAGRYEEAARLLGRVHDADPLAEDVLAAYIRALYLTGRRDAALATFARFKRELAEELGLSPLPTTAALAEVMRRGDPIELPAARQPTAGEKVSLSPSRLVGRDDARHALLTAATPVVLLKGEPGIGKSAILAEAAPGSLKARAVEGLERLPYHPLVELVRGASHLAPAVGPYRDDLARLAPELSDDPTHAPLEGDAAKARVAEAVARLVEAGGGELVVDDLQWADAATLEVVVYLAERGLKVYGAYRSGEESQDLTRALAALRGRGRLTVVDVGPIDEGSVRQLLADLIGRDEGPVAFARRLWHHTGGNPLFLLETLRSLFEAGTLRQDEHGWHTDVDEVTVDYSELAVPPRIADAIGRRLERLSAHAVRVLETLALARAPLSPLAVAEVTGLSPSAAADALDEAEAAGFLAGGRFRHDLLRQALDARVAPARRRVLHGLIAEALEPQADAGIVAEHWLEAGDTTRAREAWTRRVTELRSRGLHPAGIELAESAVARLPHGEDAAWLRLTLSTLYRETGRMDDAAAQLALVAQVEDPSPALAARRLVSEAELAMLVGQPAKAAQVFAEVEAVAATLDEDQAFVEEVAMLAAWIAREQGRYDEALARLEASVARLKQRPLSLRLVQQTSSLGTLLDDLGRHEEALAAHRESLALARALGSRYQQVESAINLVFCLGELGMHEEAVAVARAALAACGDRGYDNVAALRNNMAYSLRRLGRTAEALEQYEALSAAHHLPHVRVIAVARAAACLGELGRVSEARGKIEQALADLAAVEYGVSVASVGITVLAWADRDQVERFAAATAGFDPSSLPRYVVEELARAGRKAGERARISGAWWAPLLDER
jgi:DNA-binding SARP family transcriptional activator